MHDRMYVNKGGVTHLSHHAPGLQALGENVTWNKMMSESQQKSIRFDVRIFKKAGSKKDTLNESKGAQSNFTYDQWLQMKQQQLFQVQRGEEVCIEREDGYMDSHLCPCSLLLAYRRNVSAFFKTDSIFVLGSRSPSCSGLGQISNFTFFFF